MLTLNNPLTLDDAAIKSPNLCDRFEADDLKRIGEECWAGYTRDEMSRGQWLQRNEAGMNLALQLQEDKSFPWPGCSNVAFPLVTIAAMQFHARAYPAIVSGTDVVKCQVVGPDPTGEVSARAERISTHMSWQVLKQDKCWEDQEDKALFNASIVGTNFKKSYYSASLKSNVSELVLAKDLVLNYWAKSVNSCPRKTHLIPFSRNEIYEKVMRGTFRDVLEEGWYKGNATPAVSIQKAAEDRRQGVTPPPSDDTTTILGGEQHVNMDLDNDGYAEPYIITFDLNSKSVYRIVTRFDSSDNIERVALGRNKGKIVRIEATEYFTKRTFIPSPDGGIYDIGFGVFLGPLNESVNTLVNQLTDAGTMQNSSGGFLGRGAKIRGGIYTLAPFEWKRVDSTGDDLRKSIYPLPVNAPSDVLFQLLSLLINYTNRIAGTTDMMVGENPGQNTPAETSRTMVEMGQKIYTAIFKRVWRSLAEEFQKLYKLNARFIPAGAVLPGGATRDDYLGNPDDICPAADPAITSDAMRFNQAKMLKEAAMVTPGYNRDEVERRFLKSLQVDAVDKVFPGTEGQEPPKDVKLQIAELKISQDRAELEWDKQKFVADLMNQRELNQAKIADLLASAEEHMANAGSEQSYARVAEINAAIAATRAEGEQLNQRIQAILGREKLRIEEKKIDKPEPAKAAA